MSAGVEIAANTRNYRTVRYEDLHEHGGESLQTIFAWLGVDVSAGECGRIFDDYRMQTLRSKPPPTASWNIAAEPAEFFRRGATNSWHQDLTRNEIYLVETLTREMMERHGYRPEVSSTPWRRAIIWRALLLQYIRAGLEWRLRQLADDLRERV
jgi:hypothetical protein